MKFATILTHEGYYLIISGYYPNNKNIPLYIQKKLTNGFWGMRMRSLNYWFSTKVLATILYGLTLTLSGPVIADLQGKIYAAAEDSGNIAVFNAHTNQWMKNISVGVGTEPHNPLVSPDGKSVWVTLKGTGYIAKIDVATDTVVGTYSSGGTGPIHIDFSPDGSSLYIVNQSNDTLVKMDASNGNILATRASSAAPHDIEVSPDGSQVWVTDQTANLVNVYSNDLTTLIASIGVGADPIQLAFSIDGTLAYTSNRADSSISVLDTAGLTNIDVFNVGIGMGPMGIAMDPDGTGMWLAGTSSNTLAYTSLVDGDNYSSTFIGNLWAIHGLAISDDGSSIFASVKQDQGSDFRDALAIFDISTETLTLVAAPGAENLHGVAYVSTIPVPAAVWLFGSGLIGLIGIARSKKKT